MQRSGWNWWINLLFWVFLPLLPFYAVPLIPELPAACCSSICEPGQSDFQVWCTPGLAFFPCLSLCNDDSATEALLIDVREGLACSILLSQADGIALALGHCLYAARKLDPSLKIKFQVCISKVLPTQLWIFPKLEGARSWGQGWEAEKATCGDFIYIQPSPRLASIQIREFGCDSCLGSSG